MSSKKILIFITLLIYFVMNMSALLAIKTEVFIMMMIIWVHMALGS